MKYCYACKEKRPLNMFHKNKAKKDGLVCECKYCRKIMDLKNNRARKEKILNYYGKFCACCAGVGIIINTYEFLQIDHVNGDAVQHAKERGVNPRNSSKGLVIWIIKNVINNNGTGKERFQILCGNCNMAKGATRQCPHQSRPEDFTGNNVAVRRQIQFHKSITSLAA